MKPPAEFYTKLPERTDEEIYVMIAHAEDYLPEAVVAARDELRRRNLSPGKVAMLETTAQGAAAEEHPWAKAKYGIISLCLLPVPPGLMVFFFLTAPADLEGEAKWGPLVAGLLFGSLVCILNVLVASISIVKGERPLWPAITGLALRLPAGTWRNLPVARSADGQIFRMSGPHYSQPACRGSPLRTFFVMRIPDTRF